MTGETGAASVGKRATQTEAASFYTRDLGTGPATRSFLFIAVDMLGEDPHRSGAILFELVRCHLLDQNREAFEIARRSRAEAG